MRMPLSRKAATIVATSVLAIVLTACHYAGGGTVTSATGTGQASFSFDLNCPAGGTTQTGTLVYTDFPAHVAIRATVTGTTHNGTCWSNSASEGSGDFNGTYVSQFVGGHGSFSLHVVAGVPSLNSGDATFQLSLYGGPYDGYYNSGPVLSGAIVPLGGPNA